MCQKYCLRLDKQTEELLGMGDERSLLYVCHPSTSTISSPMSLQGTAARMLLALLLSVGLMCRSGACCERLNAVTLHRTN